MKKLLFGTENAGKLAVFRRSLKRLPVEIVGLKELYKSNSLPIEESGNSPLENAKMKARAYYDAWHVPVFSCDTGLYLKGLPEEFQPGIHVRTIDGKRLTDWEMTEYYSNLVQKYGELRGQYQNGICLILDENHVYEGSGPELSGKPFLLTSKPFPKRQEGFPLDCLSKDLKTGKYFYEMEVHKEDRVAQDQGVYWFFSQALTDAGWI